MLVGILRDKMKNILQLFEQRGFIYRKKASTLGGEFSGPCPWCGGKDRFSIHPTRDHYVCRQCHKAGDAIEFLKDYAKLTYLEACSEIGIQPSQKPNERLDYRDITKDQQSAAWEPRATTPPPLTWQNKAAAVLFESFKYIMSPAGKPHREYLNQRGIETTTIKAARIGYHFAQSTFSAQAWGYSQEHEQALKTKIWIPEGFTIPYFNDSLPVRIRIRQADPDATSRFIVVPGSSTGFFHYDQHCGVALDPADKRPWIITESELDGWLIYQTAGDIIKVFAIGNSSARPDLETHQTIAGKPGLLNLDNDTAGRKELQWWGQHYPLTRPWLSVVGKDPGEDFQAGIDIREWVQQGIQHLRDRGYLSAQSSVQNGTLQNIRESISIENPKVTIQANTKQNIVEKPTHEDNQTINSKNCIHGHYCNHHKSGCCLILGGSVFEIDECPKEYWYRYQTNEFCNQIVLGVDFKKK
jgi:hypothetical protein